MHKFLRFIKVTTLTLGALSLLLAMTLYALTLLVDPNSYKGKLTNILSSVIGREVQINGRISWQLFPSFGLTLEDALIDDSNRFQSKPLAKVKHLGFSLQVLPLLNQSIKINSLQVNGLELNLVTLKNGDFNLEALRKPQTTTHHKKIKQQHQPEGQSTTGGFQVDAVVIEDANIYWDNRKLEQKFILNKLSLKSNAIGFDKKFPIQLRFKLAKEHQYDLSIQSKTQVLIANQQIQLHDFSLNTTIHDEELFTTEQQIKLSSKQLKVIPSTQEFQLTDTVLQHGPLTLMVNASFSSQEKSPLSFTLDAQPFDLHSYLINYKKIANRLPAGSLKKASLSLNASGSKEDLDVNKIQLLVDESTLNADIKLTDTDEHTKNAVFNVNVDQLNLDKYQLKPSEQTTKTTPASKPAVPAAASTASVFAPLAKLNLNGTIQVDRLKHNNIIVGKLHTKIINKDNLLRIHPLTAFAYEGKLSSDVQINYQQPRAVISIKHQLHHINVKDIFKALAYGDQLRGMVDADVQLNTQGLNQQEFTKNLQGKAQLQLTNGKIVGTDFGYLWHEALSLFKNRPNTQQNKGYTDVAQLSANFNIAQGVMHNEDLTLYNSALLVQGQGELDLVQQRIAYDLNASEVKDIQQVGRRKQIVPGDFNLPINCRGALTKPQCAPDMSAITKQLLQQKGERVIDKVVNNIIPAEDDEQPDNNNRDALKKGVNNLLKGLLGD